MTQTDTDLTARIPVLPETRDRLSDMKEDGERYEDLLQRLMAAAENTEKAQA